MLAVIHKVSQPNKDLNLLLSFLPCLVVSVKEEQKKLFRINSSKVPEFSPTPQEKLSKVLCMQGPNTLSWSNRVPGACLWNKSD